MISLNKKTLYREVFLFCYINKIEKTMDNIHGLFLICRGPESNRTNRYLRILSPLACQFRHPGMWIDKVEAQDLN